MLDPNLSRQRQQRLLQSMESSRLDALVVGLPHHVYYLSAYRPFWQHTPAFVLFADGRSWLASANEPAKDVAADEVVAYQANFNGTLDLNQSMNVAAPVMDALRARGVKRIGIDTSAVTSLLVGLHDIKHLWVDSELWAVRRRKLADEVALIRKAVRCAEAMYRRAREIIEPGVSELYVFNELHAAAVETAGEQLSAHLGNDYACGTGGGPPRKDRPAKAGELYILDLGPAYRGYFADTSRAISVDRKPTDEQLRAWQDVTDALKIVERMARPGVRMLDVYDAVDEHYRSRGRGPFPHHLGHGIGLQPHEWPHLNAHYRNASVHNQWPDVLQEGEVFTAEPGLYGPQLGGGMRIENDYLVTAGGVENLVDSPLELA